MFIRQLRNRDTDEEREEQKGEHVAPPLVGVKEILWEESAEPLGEPRGLGAAAT